MVPNDDTWDASKRERRAPIMSDAGASRKGREVVANEPRW